MLFRSDVFLDYSLDEFYSDANDLIQTMGSKDLFILILDTKKDNIEEIYIQHGRNEKVNKEIIRKIK